MIFYRLGLQRLIAYFKLDQIFKDEERRQQLLHKKPKEIYRTRLQADRTMDLCVSTLLSIISALVCISIPFAALESPCEVLKKHNLSTIYTLAKYFERYANMIDRLIIALSVILVYISVKTVMDAIKNTNINMSPWLERGKYVLPNQKEQMKQDMNSSSKIYWI